MSNCAIQIPILKLWSGKYKVVNYFNGGILGEGYTLEEAKARRKGGYAAIVRNDAEWIFDHRIDAWCWNSESQENEKNKRMEKIMNTRTLWAIRVDGRKVEVTFDKESYLDLYERENPDSRVEAEIASIKDLFSVCDGSGSSAYGGCCDGLSVRFEEGIFEFDEETEDFVYPRFMELAATQAAI